MAFRHILALPQQTKYTQKSFGRSPECDLFHPEPRTLAQIAQQDFQRHPNERRLAFTIRPSRTKPPVVPEAEGGRILPHKRAVCSIATGLQCNYYWGELNN